jgi:prepilin-type N-terminal cleavage/methylation domain-containing protein
MNRYQVKAFTIMEVTITMLIASILMGITYSTYSIISRSYLAFNTKNKDMAELQQLDHYLKKDFDRAEFIQKNAEGILLKNNDRIITYSFQPDFVLRISSITDTFKVKNAEINTLFEGLPVDLSGSSDEQNRIDELSVSLLLQNEKIPYHYYKRYSSLNLIQRNADAFH